MASASAAEDRRAEQIDPVAGGERLVMYKTKLIQFLGRSTPIILQNDNGPCPLLAICNVLLLRNVINLNPDVPEVSQDQLLAMVADRLLESNSDVKSKDEGYVNNQQQNISDAIDLLPRLTTGIDVNVHFRKINDFEFTRECAIFDLLDIGLYHGWIVDPEDKLTAKAIGSKSYNMLVGELVAQDSQDRSFPPEEDTVDFAAATAATLGIPSPSLSRGLSFDDPLPVVPSEKVGRRGDLEEEAELMKALALSKSQVSTISTPTAKCLSPENISSNASSDYEEGAAVEFSKTIGNSESLHGEAVYNHGTMHSESNLFPLNGTESLSKLEAVSVGDIMENDYQISKTVDTNHLGQTTAQSYKSEDHQVCSVVTTQPSLSTAAAVVDDVVSSIFDSNLINLQEGVPIDTEGLADESIFGQSGNKSSGISVHDSPSNIDGGDSGGRDFVNGNQNVCSNLEGKEPIYEGEDCILESRHLDQEPIYEGEVVLANQHDEIEANITSVQFDNEASRTGSATMSSEEGQLIRNFLKNNASQLTIYGLFCLQEGLKERELCVFFRNNHFSTMFKFEKELYLLATDQGYLNQPDLVWEKLNEVNGDTVFMTANFKEFTMENQSDSWNQHDAMSNTADFLRTMKDSALEGSTLSSDLQLAIALQEQEFDQQPVCPEPQDSQRTQITPRPRLVTGPQVPARPVPPPKESKSKDKCVVM